MGSSFIDPDKSRSGLCGLEWRPVSILSAQAKTLEEFDNSTPFPQFNYREGIYEIRWKDHGLRFTLSYSLGGIQHPISLTYNFLNKQVHQGNISDLSNSNPIHQDSIKENYNDVLLHNIAGNIFCPLDLDNKFPSQEIAHLDNFHKLQRCMAQRNIFLHIQFCLADNKFRSLPTIPLDNINGSQH
jgi:hypothetical protein